MRVNIELIPASLIEKQKPVRLSKKGKERKGKKRGQGEGEKKSEPRTQSSHEQFSIL